MPKKEYVDDYIKEIGPDPVPSAPNPVMKKIDSLTDEQAVLFDHTSADSHFGASVFWIRRLATLGGEQTMIEYWKTKRGGGERGIMELVEKRHDHQR
jgi:hypothetical protein